MAPPFSSRSWGNHKVTLKHQRALGLPVWQRMKTTRARPRVPVADPSPARDDQLHGDFSPSGGVDFSAALLLGAQSDQEFLSLCYKGLQKKKRERTRFEAEVHDVVNAMTNLITEQQDELDAMRRTVERNARALDSLTADVRVLQTQTCRGSEHQESQRGQLPLHSQRHDDSATKRSQRSPLLSKPSRNSTIQHQESNQSPRNSRHHGGTALQRYGRSPNSHHVVQRSVSPPLFSPPRQASALKRSRKSLTTLRSHEKSALDPFEWSDHDDEDDGTRRMLHMSQYA